MTSQDIYINQDEISRQRLRIFLDAQIEEVYKYKWYLGEEMHRDPLEEYTFNDIFIMWVNNNAKNFRAKWILEHGSGYFYGVDNPI